MIEGAAKSLGEILKKMFVVGIILLVIFVPLGIWKLIDLIHLLAKH